MGAGGGHDDPVTVHAFVLTPSCPPSCSITGIHREACIGLSSWLWPTQLRHHSQPQRGFHQGWNIAAPNFST